MLLSALLDAPSFHQAAEEVAATFRSRHGLPPLRQIGCVVPDVTAAVASLEARGVGPFLSFRGAPRSWTERGAAGQFTGEMALGVHEDLEIELLAPGTGSDLYRERLDAQGRIAVHHVGFAVDEIEPWTALMAAAGYAPRVEGRLGLGPVTTEFAYFDTVAEAGTMVEFIRFSFGGRPVSRSAARLAALIRRARRA